jgi:curli biogenesis system outer membrane secretion channel CsgG
MLGSPQRCQKCLTTELGATGKLRTISGENVTRMKADLSLPDSESLANETLAKVYRMLDTDLVVLGFYLDIGGQIRVDLRVQDTSTGEIVSTAPELGSEAQFLRTGEACRTVPAAELRCGRTYRRTTSSHQRFTAR